MPISMVGSENEREPKDKNIIFWRFIVQKTINFIVDESKSNFYIFVVPTFDIFTELYAV